MKILIDNGHGIQTSGKRSPDGKLLEYSYTREIANQVVSELKAQGYDAELLVPEPDDIPLSERVKRVNAICLSSEPSCPTLSPSCPTRSGISATTGHLTPNVILISIHLNAAGDGTKWMNAAGWSCYTCKGQTESDTLATCLYKAAEHILKDQVIRTDYARDNDPDWEENFYILRHTLCPAVLTENFFMDGLDFEFLQSKACKQAIVDTHVNGIIEYFESL